MSQLIDTLQRIAGAASQPMGFGAARTATATPRILLIAIIDPTTLDNQASHLDNADAVLIQSVKSRLTLKNIQKAAESLPNKPWGVSLGNSDGKKTDTLIEAGCDFVMFPATGNISDAPTDEKIGRILQVESSMDDGLIRTINDLPIDAVFIDDTYETSHSMIWHQLMILQHIANLIKKPLLASVPANITEIELKAMWEAGIDGVVVTTDNAVLEDLPTIRENIDKLPARSMRKRGRVEAVLPRTSSEEIRPAIPDDDEEYE